MLCLFKSFRITRSFLAIAYKARIFMYLLWILTMNEYHRSLPWNAIPFDLDFISFEKLFSYKI